MYIHSFAALLNIVFNFFLIPLIGIVGAAIATLISYFSMTVICLYVSFKYLKFNLNSIFVFKCLISSSIMSGIIFLINPSNITELFVSVVSGAFVYFSVMVLIGGISNYELNLIKKLSKSSIAKFI